MTTSTGDRDPAHEGGVAPAERWEVDPQRSHVGFRVRKMGLYHVKGRFRRFTGHVDVGPEGEPRGGQLRIEAASVHTRMPPRDLHLRTRDFLHVERHPEIALRAQDILTGPDGRLKVPLHVDLHGTQAHVELEGHLHDQPDAPDARVLHLHGVLDRHAFGVRPRPPFDWVVGREVSLDVSLTLQRPSAR